MCADGILLLEQVSAVIWLRTVWSKAGIWMNLQLRKYVWWLYKYWLFLILFWINAICLVEKCVHIFYIHLHIRAFIYSKKRIKDIFYVSFQWVWQFFLRVVSHMHQIASVESSKTTEALKNTQIQLDWALKCPKIDPTIHRNLPENPYKCTIPSVLA